MNKILQWMKGNVAIVAAMAVALLCVAFVGLVTLVLRGKVIASVEKQVASQTQAAETLLTQTKVKLPGQEPGTPMIELSGKGSRRIVATPALIAAVQTIWAEFAKTGKDMRDLSRQINGRAHESVCILPDSGTVDTFNIATLKMNYRNSFAAALWHPRYPVSGAPALSEADLKAVAINPLLAAPAFTARQLQDVADVAIREKLRSLGVEKYTDLATNQKKAAETEARNRVVEALTTRAGSIGIYAETDQSQPSWPFSGMWRDWGREGTIPPPDLAYESQADLWILRDLVEALRSANRIGDNGSSVLTAPVKRLVRVQAQRDGYVGLHTMGLVVAPAAAGASAGAYPVPSFSLLPESVPQVENYFVSPTGRICNSIYDVKHTKLEVIVDVRRLPELIEAISAANMMTVVAVDLEDVDEYKELQEGLYYYGACDAVKATLVVESIWMRSWTALKMPAATRNYLKITPTVQ